MKEDIIKFAVVGAGHIGKRHAEMISRNSSDRNQYHVEDEI